MSVPRALQLLRPATTTLSRHQRLRRSIPRVYSDERAHDTTADFRSTQKSRQLNPHLTNTTSTIANDLPKVGAHNAPADLLSSVSSDFKPTDASPRNTHKMTGGTQQQGARAQEMLDREGKEQGELGVGELEGAQFKVEPLRRSGEDIKTMRARLLCPSHLFLSSLCLSS